MAWYDANTGRPLTPDEADEIDYRRSSSAIVRGYKGVTIPLRHGLQMGMNVMGSQAPNDPDPITKATSEYLVQHDPIDELLVAGQLSLPAAGEALAGVKALEGVSPLVRGAVRYGAPVAAGYGLARATGENPEQAAVTALLTSGGGDIARGGIGWGAKKLMSGRDKALRNDMIADWISTKFNVHLTGKDLESQLVRGGPTTGLPSMVPAAGSQKLSWDEFGVPTISAGKQKDAAIYVKQAFANAWDPELHELNQPKLVEQIRGPLWDSLVRTMGLDEAQQLLNVVSNHPLEMAANATGRLADIRREPMSVRVHPGIPPSVSIHPGVRYQMSGQEPDYMQPLTSMASIMAGYGEPSIRSGVRQFMPDYPPMLTAPLPVPPGPAPAPPGLPAAVPNAAPTALPTRVPLAVPAAAHGGGPAWYAPSRTRRGFHAPSAPSAASGPSARATAAHLPRFVGVGRMGVAEAEEEAPDAGVALEWFGKLYNAKFKEPVANALSRFMPREDAEKKAEGFGRFIDTMPDTAVWAIKMAMGTAVGGGLYRLMTAGPRKVATTGKFATQSFARAVRGPEVPPEGPSLYDLRVPPMRQGPLAVHPEWAQQMLRKVKPVTEEDITKWIEANPNLSDEDLFKAIFRSTLPKIEEAAQAVAAEAEKAAPAVEGAAEGVAEELPKIILP